MEKSKQVETADGTRKITDGDLRRALDEVSVAVLKENRDEIIKRAHALLRKKFRTERKD